MSVRACGHATPHCKIAKHACAHQSHLAHGREPRRTAHRAASRTHRRAPAAARAGIFRHGYEPRLNAQAGFPVFATFLEANNVKRRADDFSLHAMTEDTLAEIQRLARDRKVGERIIDSIAPSIYGHPDIKASLALALFGGQEKQVGSHRLRRASPPQQPLPFAPVA